ncbi:MAG: DMT family transporter [Deinococcales bacterium]|nr:DMT family transporter [Deinococcales bacterium]
MRVPYPEESWVLSLYLAKKGTLKLAVFKHWSGFRSLLTLTFAAFVAVVVINGGVSVAVRFSYVELPTFWGATLRFGVATIILWVLLALFKGKIPHGRALITSLLFGVLGVGGASSLMYWSLETIPASLHSIIVSVVPLLTLFFAFFHRLETLNRRSVIGVFLAAVGVAIAYGGTVSGDVSVVRLLALLLAAVCMAEAGVVMKPFAHLDPLAVSAIAATVGTVMIAVVSIIAGETWVLPSTAGMWWILIYLAVGTSVLGFLLYLYVLKRWTASATSYSMVLIPLVTVVIANVLAGEQITWLFIIGGLLVLGGVWFGALMPRRNYIDEKT